MMGGNQYTDSYVSEELNPSLGFWVKTKRRVASLKSPYQEIELIETESFGLALRIDNYWMTSEKDEFYYHENMVHPAAIGFGAPSSALIIGGGDGGAAEEYLKYNSIKKVVLVEIDAEVIKFCKEHLQVIHRGAFDDPRLHLEITDGKVFVEETEQHFDLMMLDLTDPFGPAEALYGVEFLGQCKRVLNQGGILSIHLGSPVTRPALYGRLLATLRKVFRIVRPFLVYCPLYGTWWGMATASDETDPTSLTPTEVEGRIISSKLRDLQFYNSATHFGIFSLPNFVVDIGKGDALPVSQQYPLNESGLDPREHAPIRVVKSSPKQVEE